MRLYSSAFQLQTDEQLTVLAYEYLRRRVIAHFCIRKLDNDLNDMAQTC